MAEEEGEEEEDEGEEEEEKEEKAEGWLAVRICSAVGRIWGGRK